MPCSVTSVIWLVSHNHGVSASLGLTRLCAHAATAAVQVSLGMCQLKCNQAPSPAAVVVLECRQHHLAHKAAQEVRHQLQGRGQQAGPGGLCSTTWNKRTHCKTGSHQPKMLRHCCGKLCDVAESGFGVEAASGTADTHQSPVVASN